MIHGFTISYLRGLLPINQFANRIQELFNISQTLTLLHDVFKIVFIILILENNLKIYKNVFQNLTMNFSHSGHNVENETYVRRLCTHYFTTFVT